jgi:hypothetical protein
VSGKQADLTRVPRLTASELRVLPLLTASLSLDEIAEALEMPRSRWHAARSRSLHARFAYMGRKLSATWAECT